MTSERRRINMTPPTTLWKNVVRGASYTVIESFYELVDNSIDSAAEYQRGPHETVTVKISVNPSRVIVSDDGEGMDPARLEKAMIPGISDKATNKYKDTNIGQFGEKMKIAPFVFGIKYSITSGVEGSTSTQTVEFDIDHFENWTDNEMVINHLTKKPEEHGTTIVVTEIRPEKINSRSLTRLVSQMRRDFGKRYRKLLRDNRVRIFVNNKAVQPEEIQWELNQPIHDMVECKFGNIECEYGLTKLERGNARGIDILYRGRVIEEGTTFGTDNQGMSARIRGSIDCTFLPISDDKLKVLRETNEYREIERTIKNSPKFTEFMRIVKQVSKVGHQPQPRNVERVVDEIFKRISAGIHKPEFLDRLQKVGINVSKRHVDAVPSTNAQEKEISTRLEMIMFGMGLSNYVLL